MGPTRFQIKFAGREAYDHFQSVDCPELRGLLARLQSAPFPDGGNIYAIPDEDTPKYFICDVIAGVRFSIAYRVDYDGNYVLVLAVSIQSMPTFPTPDGW